MQTVTVRNIKIGEGIPKICVPIVGITQEEILQSAKQLQYFSADLAEWRADWFAQVSDVGAVDKLLGGLREALGELPLIVTFRTKNEGGEKSIETEAYLAFYEAVIRSAKADCIDVELFLGDAAVRRLVDAAHAAGVKVIASNHDFCKTPPKEELISRLRAMQQLGTDILKIAVMPQSKADVLTLLLATVEMYENYADKPIVTMAMGSDGVISRLCGEVFGSAITFGAAGKTSAPGQMQAEQLRQILTLLHEQMGKNKE